MPTGKLRLLPALLLALLISGAAPALPAENAQNEEKPPEQQREKTPYEKFLEKGAIVEFPERPWDQAFVYNSGAYAVRTNTSQDVAEYTGVLMDAVNYHYCRLFNIRTSRRTAINVFRTKDEMAAWAKENCNFTVGNYIGFFTTYGGGTICVTWQEIRGMKPETVLMHEGTHQFVNAGWGPGTLPTWLNEGFAVYFETSVFDGKDLDVGQVPKGRLQWLQGKMKEEEHVPLEKIFDFDTQAAAGSGGKKKKKQAKFPVENYASSWAFVYYLAHSGDERQRAIHQVALGKFVNDCRRGRKDGRRLAAYLGLEMADLEKQWKEWVLELDPEDPYGGTRKTEEAEDEKEVEKKVNPLKASKRGAGK